MKVKVDVTLDKLGKLTKSLAALSKKQVLVGIPAEETERKVDAATGAAEPINNAALGYIHENGAAEVGIPPRPFLVPGVQSAHDKLAKRLKAAAVAATDGKADIVDKNLNAAGIEASTSVKSTIAAGIDPPLNPRTLAARRRRGRTGEVPLIDTGQLRNSITYVIKGK